ncbi:MAG: sugar phosphate isomerase/epimerase [Maritimibacter sp.]|nr:sugar phosphate isomerase/epimerase [Maritimibacter sp.]
MRNAKLGVHNLVFTDQWTEANAQDATAKAAEIGFDLFEVLIFDPADLDTKMTGRVVADAGLELRLGMALGADADISSPDAAVARRGEETVERCLRIASDLGAPAVSGIVYAAFNNYGAGPTQAQWDSVREALARLDRRAGELGVKLGLEAVNRYESYLVNTLDQAGDMIRQIGASNLFVHMDTFHMNIEESDIAAAIGRNADLLGYAHLADNTRGLLGAGTYDFKTYFRALAACGYGGEFTVESFSPAALSADLAAAVSIWRAPWDRPEHAARQALEFMRAEIAAATSAVQVW